MKSTLVTKENIKFFKNLFPKENLPREAFIIGAIEEGVPCGILIVTSCAPDYELSYIYVDEDCRNKGAAREMLLHAHFITQRSGIDCLRCGISSDNNEVISYLLNAGFEEEITFPKISVKLSDLSPFYTKELHLKEGYDCISLDVLPSYLWNVFIEICNKGENIPLVKNEDNYNTKLSFILTKEKKVKGGILVSEIPGGLSVDFLAIFESGKSSYVPILIHNASKKAHEIYPDDTTVSFVCMNESVEKFVEKFAGESRQADDGVSLKELFYTY